MTLPKTLTGTTRVFVISPFRGNVAESIAYALECARDCLKRGEAPFVPHMHYPQFLDDDNEDERGLGIQCSWLWLMAADRAVVYADNGVSDGMLADMNEAQRIGVGIETRRLR